MEFDFDVVQVHGRINEIADALSRKTEPATSSALVVDHFVRDKKQPSEEGERRSLSERAHLLGHFGETAIFKNYGTTVIGDER